MEDPFVNIKEETLGYNEANTGCILELIVNNDAEPEPVGTIKIQFQLNEEKVFQTDYKTCLICNESCKTSSDVRRHMLLHSQTPFTCNLFDLQFFLKWNIKLSQSSSDHYNEEEKEVPYQTADEPENIKESNDVNAAEVRSVNPHPGKSRHVSVGDEITSTSAPNKNLSLGGSQAKIALETLFPTHAGENYICMFCDFETSNRVLFRDHKKKFHAAQIKLFSCKQCDFKTPTRSCFNRHMILTHYPTMRRYCNKCKLELSNGPDYYAHLKTHEKLKEKLSFQCDVCGMVFNTKQNMIGHMHIHNGIKPFKCDFCDYETAYQNSLKIHKRIHTKEKPYICDKCDYRAATQQRLKFHMRSHTGEKLGVCTMCDFKCRDKDKLKRHMRTHTGEKPYSCELCSYKCSLSGNMHTHVEGVHGLTRTNRFYCSNCIFRCYVKSNLEKHMKIHSVVNKHKVAEIKI